MQRLVEEIQRIARQIQRDLAEIPNGSDDSIQSTRSVDQLTRIERKLDSIHGDTGELVTRVPNDLSLVLADLKECLLFRLTDPTRSDESTRTDVHAPRGMPNQSTRSDVETIESLTSQERSIFQLCFQSGFLSYRDIADHLDITAGAAKNLVNRIFQSDRKRPLFVKQYKRGAALVGIRTSLKDRILHGRGPAKAKPVAAAVTS